MELNYKSITLKSFTELEIEDEVRWMTVETQWMREDTPWEEPESIDPVDLRKQMQEIMTNDYQSFVQSRSEIFVKEKHIGFVTIYPLTTADYYFEHQDTEQKYEYAVGVEICEPAFWGCGYGTEALTAWVHFWENQGIKVLYLETWSGNNRMIKCAEKCGFSLLGQKTQTHVVENEYVHSLLFQIDFIKEQKDLQY